MSRITSVADLDALYGTPNEASTVKELDHLSAEYRRYLDASPFVLLATAGPEGLDCSLRVNGTATVRDDADLLAGFVVEGTAPRTVIVIRIETVFFQCARAMVRADLWNPARHVDPATLPTAGEILAACSDHRVGGPAYDQQWAERARKTLW